MLQLSLSLSLSGPLLSAVRSVSVQLRVSACLYGPWPLLMASNLVLVVVLRFFSVRPSSSHFTLVQASSIKAQDTDRQTLWPVSNSNSSFSINSTSDDLRLVVALHLEPPVWRRGPRVARCSLLSSSQVTGTGDDDHANRRAKLCAGPRVSNSRPSGWTRWGLQNEPPAGRFAAFAPKLLAHCRLILVAFTRPMRHASSEQRAQTIRTAPCPHPQLRPVE